MECFPAFDYARDDHEMESSPAARVFRSPTLSLGLATRVPLEQRRDGVAAGFTLQEEQTVVFVLRETEAGADCGVCFSERRGRELSSCGPWSTGGAGSRSAPTTGRWREMVHRSALA